MMKMTSKRTLLLGLLIIVLSNAIALVGVAYNRSGEPTSSLTLTERELTLPGSYGFAVENSGISLQLRWRVFDNKKTSIYYSNWLQTEWLDADKLALLGFDVSYSIKKPNSREFYKKALNKEVFLVVENDGATYQKVLQQRQEALTTAQRLHKQNPDKKEFKTRLKNAKASLKSEQHGYSRLFVIDAGLDYETLRKQYSNNSQYLIARGQVALRFTERRGGKPYLIGIIRQPSVEKVNLPLEHASMLKPLMNKNNRRKKNELPRYEVTLKYGQRYEPWVTNVIRYDNGS